MALEPGARLGPYEIQAAIGAGGMGEVYKARDTRLGRTVALKVLPAGAASAPERRRRFEQEARAASSLNHPHICVLHDIGLHDGADFLVMEYLEGQTLAQRIAEGPLPVAEALQFGGEIASALDTAHRQGIIHRDLKPGNVIVTKTGTKLLDFGLAKLKTPGGPGSDPGMTLATTEAPLTAEGTMLGTVGYMAPEQLEGREADARSDLFALGAVIYEMLTGRRAFEGATSASVIAAILDRDPQPPSSLLPSIPPALDRLIQRCLAKNPDHRWDSARDVLLELRSIGAADADRAPSAPGAQRAAGGRVVWARRAAAMRSWRASAAAAMLAVAAVLAWFALAWWTRPALTFKERDFVLVADVVNETGERVFDLALKSAIEMDLRQSRYVNVYDATQVQNTLRLMRQPPDAPLNATLGRDLSRRVGVRALVVPSILKAGEAYQLGASVVEPSSGRTVDDVRVTASGREQVLLSAIDELTRQLRRRLGESLASVARSDPPLAQMTTSSLEALDFAALGARASGRGDHATAERDYRQALELDSRFAAARASLGLVLLQFLNRPEEGKRELARALQDAGQVSQREHLHLRALNRQYVTEDLPAALDDYRFMAELYPDMFQPYNNSGRILEKMGRYEAAAAMYERAHQAAPRHLVPLWNRYFICANRLKAPRKAEAAARALVELEPEAASTRHALAWSLVMQRRFAEAEQAMQAVLTLDPAHALARANLGNLQLRRGAVQDAVASYRSLPRDGFGEHDALCLALALHQAGRPAEAVSVSRAAADGMKVRARTARLDPAEQALLAALLAVAGRSSEARSLVSRAERAGGPPDRDALWLARAYVALGEDERAAALVQGALEAGAGDPYYILIDPSLAAVRDRPQIDRLVPAGQ